MHIELCQLTRESAFFEKEITEKFLHVTRNADFILRQETKNFEMHFAQYIGTDYAVGTKSGTSALMLGMLALGIGIGDEVITTPLTFIATAEAIVQTGATPVFCDVKGLDGNIDEAQIEHYITPKTKAVLGVHLYGNPCNNDAILALCKKYDLFYIEDASHAHGVTDAGKKLGSFGDIACFSFMPAKVLGAYGDAGIVTTNNKEIAQKIEKLRNHGREDKHTHSMIGYNERIDNLQAAILDIKLGKLNDFLKLRRNHARKYIEKLPFDAYFPKEKLTYLNFFAYCIKVTQREELIEKLSASGISTGLYYPIALHLQPSLSFLGYKKGDFPIAEHIAQTSLAIPVHHFLAEQEADFIIDTLKNLSHYAL